MSLVRSFFVGGGGGGGHLRAKVLSLLQPNFPDLFSCFWRTWCRSVAVLLIFK